LMVGGRAFKDEAISSWRFYEKSIFVWYDELVDHGLTLIVICHWSVCGRLSRAVLSSMDKLINKWRSFSACNRLERFESTTWLQRFDVDSVKIIRCVKLASI
jgi:hypothetical protein